MAKILLKDDLYDSSSLPTIEDKLAYEKLFEDIPNNENREEL